MQERRCIYCLILLCLENILAMIVLFRCRRMIPQIKMLTINLSITDFCTGLMLCLPDDTVNSCIYKKYLAGPFVVVSLLTITVIFMLCFDLYSEVLRHCNKKVPFVYMRLHPDLFIFTHLRHVSRYPFPVRYLLWNLIPDSERASKVWPVFLEKRTETLTDRQIYKKMLKSKMNTETLKMSMESSGNYP